MQFFASLLVLLSVFNVAIAAEKYPAAELQVRQAPADQCADYSKTANMSVIGTNSSYRTAFMQKAPVGTIITARMLNAAMLKLPALTANAQLNQQCGNLTQVAITEAATNYTKGIVAQFTTEGLPVGIKAGPEVVVITGAISIIFSIVWVFSG